MTERSGSRILLALALGMFLAVRALVPAGMMPVQTAQGYAVTLCTGAGPVDGWVDASGKFHKGQSGKGQSKSDCPFAGLGAKMVFAAPSAFVPATLVHFRTVNAFPGIVGIGHGLAAPPPPQTGPPALT
ncbi:MAG: DUF2946 family protein [Novosphingobium sp.]